MFVDDHEFHNDREKSVPGHSNPNATARTFWTLNCPTLPDDLVEEELANQRFGGRVTLGAATVAALARYD